MAIVEFTALFVAGAACAGTALFLLGLVFVDVTETGWRIKCPW